MYHHSRPLETVRHGVIRPDPEWVDPEWPELTAAYRWLEQEVGFYPLFVMVGDQECCIAMTGYAYQWQRKLSQDENGNWIYRKKGEFPNYVLFSFEKLDGVYMNLSYWDVVLTAALNHRLETITAQDKRILFKYSWPKSRWLRKVSQPDHQPVQMVVPELDLRKANQVWVRNQPTKRQLESMGFENVEVKRIKVPKV